MLLEVVMALAEGNMKNVGLRKFGLIGIKHILLLIEASMQASSTVTKPHYYSYMENTEY